MKIEVGRIFKEFEGKFLRKNAENAAERLQKSNINARRLCQVRVLIKSIDMSMP